MLPVVMRPLISKYPPINTVHKVLNPINKFIAGKYTASVTARFTELLR